MGRRLRRVSRGKRGAWPHPSRAEHFPVCESQKENTCQNGRLWTSKTTPYVGPGEPDLGQAASSLAPHYPSVHSPCLDANTYCCSGGPLEISISTCRTTDSHTRSYFWPHLKQPSLADQQSCSPSSGASPHRDLTWAQRRSRVPWDLPPTTSQYYGGYYRSLLRFRGRYQGN